MQPSAVPPSCGWFIFVAVAVVAVVGGCIVGFVICDDLYALPDALWVSAVVKVFLNLEFVFIFG